MWDPHPEVLSTQARVNCWQSWILWLVLVVVVGDILSARHMLYHLNYMVCNCYYQNIHCKIYHHLFIISTVDGHLGYLYFLFIMSYGFLLSWGTPMAFRGYSWQVGDHMGSRIKAGLAVCKTNSLPTVVFWIHLLDYNDYDVLENIKYCIQLLYKYMSLILMGENCILK